MGEVGTVDGSLDHSAQSARRRHVVNAAIVDEMPGAVALLHR
jgi:hypothetical protein